MHRDTVDCGIDVVDVFAGAAIATSMTRGGAFAGRWESPRTISDDDVPIGCVPLPKIDNVLAKPPLPPPAAPVVVFELGANRSRRIVFGSVVVAVPFATGCADVHTAFVPTVLLHGDTIDPGGQHT